MSAPGASLGAPSQLHLGNGCPFHVAALALPPGPDGRRRTASGRGLTKLEAEMRCLAESVERQCAVFGPTVPVRRGTHPRNAIAAPSLLLISRRQLENAASWNARVEPDHRLPENAEEQETDWVAGRLFATGSEVILPAAICYLGYPDPLAEGFPVPDSSGLAAHPTLSGAVSHALLELVERDAVSIWWYNRIRRPAMPIEAGVADLARAFADWTARCGKKFWTLDLTTDLGFPVAAVVTCGVDGRNISLGFGAGPSGATAIQAAMGELVQFEATKALRAEKGEAAAHDWVDACTAASIEDWPFLVPEGAESPIETDVDLAGRFLAAANDPADVDLTQPDTGLHVVRAVAPGLRPIWPRFAPGRLYDVPVALKWRTRPLAETELNPVPILY